MTYKSYFIFDTKLCILCVCYVAFSDLRSRKPKCIYMFALKSPESPKYFYIYPKGIPFFNLKNSFDHKTKTAYRIKLCFYPIKDRKFYLFVSKYEISSYKSFFLFYGGANDWQIWSICKLIIFYCHPLIPFPFTNLKESIITFSFVSIIDTSQLDKYFS